MGTKKPREIDGIAIKMCRLWPDQNERTHDSRLSALVCGHLTLPALQTPHASPS